MKKLSIIFLILVFLHTTLYAIPTDEQIRQYARDLGVPFEELKLLVEKYNKVNPSIFKDSRANTAQIIDISEADFLQKTNTAQNGKLYHIKKDNCYFSGQRGDMVVLWTINPESNSNVVVKATSVYRINSGTPVDVLLQYKRDGTRGDFYIVEIVY